MQRERADGDHINLGAISNAHRHLVSRQSLFIPQLLFRVTNMSNRSSIKYPGTTTITNKIHINNMYIEYTFLLDVAVLQIRQVLGAVTLLVTGTLAVEAFSFRLRTNLGLLSRCGCFLAILLEVALVLRLALFLEIGGLIDHQHLVFFHDLHFSSFQHGR